MSKFDKILHKYDFATTMGGDITEGAGNAFNIRNMSLDLEKLLRQSSSIQWIYMGAIVVVLGVCIYFFGSATLGVGPGRYAISGATGISVPWAFARLREAWSDKVYSDLTILIIKRANPSTTAEVLQLLREIRRPHSGSK